MYVQIIQYDFTGDVESFKSGSADGGERGSHRGG